MTGAPFTRKPIAASLSAGAVGAGSSTPPPTTFEQRVIEVLRSQSGIITRHTLAMRSLSIAVMLASGVDVEKVVGYMREMRDDGFRDTDNRPTAEITELIGIVTTVAEEVKRRVPPAGGA